ncbi:DUF6792 domain-containing protein [Fictibacillus iocasae]|uniref:DUF6792 domain-containing protein n=1 Tax=Fictibacillus iocasae TaxID=2715437 RepID=A0ABW2NST0_9BACL
MNSNILNTNVIRTRIAELEYKNITVDQIRKIYIEETGKAPPGKITVYKSDDYPVSGKDSGFDGTVIHFYDEATNINTAYTITRGSENKEKGSSIALDWLYNGMGIFVGHNESQYRDAKKFDKSVTEKIKQQTGDNIQLSKYGIGHSLGGNLIQMLQLLNGGFEEVYAINDAPPSAYQLAALDVDYWYLLAKKFNLNSSDFNQIYSIPPSKLKEFTEQYYKEKGKNIHHLTAYEDMLYAASIIRGFIDLGEREFVDTDPEFDGIRTMIDDVSDEDLQKLQVFLAKYAPAYEKNGFDGLLAKMLGITVNQLGDLREAFGEMKDADDSLEHFLAAKKLIPLCLTVSPDVIKQLYKEKGNVLTLMKVAWNIHGEDLNEIDAHLDGMIEDIKTIRETIGQLSELNIFKVSFNPLNYLEDLASIKQAFNTIKKCLTSLFDRFDEIKETVKNIKPKYDKSVHAHGAGTVANALAKEKGLRYVKGEMILTKSGGNGKPIEVNLSSAVTIYQTGIDKYREMEENASQLRTAYDFEYVYDFDQRKSKLMQKIHDMEASPSSYEYLLENENYTVTSISVEEELPGLNSAFHETFEEMFASYEVELEKGKALLQRMKTSITDLFQEDKRIAAIFELR